MLQLLKPLRLELVLCSKRNHCNEKLRHHNERAVPARCNYRQPTQSKEYAAQPEKKNQVLSNNYTIELRQ